MQGIELSPPGQAQSHTGGNEVSDFNAVTGEDNDSAGMQDAEYTLAGKQNSICACILCQHTNLLIVYVTVSYEPSKAEKASALDRLKKACQAKYSKK